MHRDFIKKILKSLASAAHYDMLEPYSGIRAILNWFNQIIMHDVWLLIYYEIVMSYA